MSSTPDRHDKIKRRADMACTVCRRRKLKCHNTDNEPPCERCKTMGAPSKCLFLPVADDPSGKGSRTSSCDSTEESLRTQSSLSVPTPSAQVTHPISLANSDRPVNIAMPPQTTAPFSPSYTPLDQAPYPMHPSRSTRKGPPTPGDRSTIDRAGFCKSTEDPVFPSSPWPSSGGPTYTQEPRSYHYPEPALPAVPTPSTPPYHYSPTPSLPYGQEFHGQDQHPRALHATHQNPYYNQPDSSQQGSHHPPYPTSQHSTSVIPGYAQPHSPNSSSLDANHYYAPYSR